MADLVRSRVDAFVAARVAATSTTVAPTTTSRASTPTTAEAAVGSDDPHIRALRSPGAGDDDDGAVWFAVIGAALVVAVVIAAVVAARLRARARSRNAG